MSVNAKDRKPPKHPQGTGSLNPHNGAGGSYGRDEAAPHIQRATTTESATKKASEGKGLLVLKITTKKHL